MHISFFLTLFIIAFLSFFSLPFEGRRYTLRQFLGPSSASSHFRHLRLLITPPYYCGPLSIRRFPTRMSWRSYLLPFWLYLPPFSPPLELSVISVYNLNTGGVPWFAYLGFCDCGCISTPLASPPLDTFACTENGLASTLFVRDDPSLFDSSLLTHVFRYDPFFSLDGPLFLLFASPLIQLHKLVYHSCRSLTKWRLGTFGIRLRGLEKKVSAPCLHYHSLCIRTFFGWTLATSSTFLHLVHRRRIGRGETISLGCRPRWQVL